MVTAETGAKENPKFIRPQTADVGVEPQDPVLNFLSAPAITDLTPLPRPKRPLNAEELWIPSVRFNPLHKPGLI